MDKTFQKLLQTDIDLSSLGVERRTDDEPYFCTPKGASVFGWTGVDGIHFCFVRGFGGMVFAVSPANTFPNYVHPLAKNFADFLRLLLACGDVAHAGAAGNPCACRYEIKADANGAAMGIYQRASGIF